MSFLQSCDTCAPAAPLATGVGISIRRLLNVRFEKLSDADLLEAVVRLRGNYTPVNTIISGRGTEH